MIAKHINRSVNSNYGRLAQYIAAASEKGEKLDELWMVNCNAGTDLEDIDHGIAEIEATQALNTRAKSDKTYHLLLSFRDEKPSPEALKDIEEQFAAALGFGDHQRIAATHTNTDNFHMHIAINKINPDTLKIHHPSHDYRTLEETCRAMEKKHGLKIDRGRQDTLDKIKMPVAARDMEAHSWEQSFDGYVRGLLPKLDTARKNAKSWQDLHDSFGEHGLNLNLRGNGLVISDAKHKSRHMKASSLSRAFSKAALEKHLGPFVASGKAVQAAKHYEAKPLTKHKGQTPLWRKYKKRGLMSQAYRTWKEFLHAEAINDPLAMAIIIAQRKMIKTIGKGMRMGD